MKPNPDPRRRAARLPGPRPLATLLAGALLALLPACAVGTYLGDRGMDLIDVVDLKYGFGAETFGIGGKLEITEFFGLAAGYGRSDLVHEGRGRFAWDEENHFGHYVLFGGDGPSSRPTMNFSFMNPFYYGPLSAQWRVGLEVLLPRAHMGGYLNLMEIVDLFAGLVTLDPSGDDGVSRGEPLEIIE